VHGRGELRLALPPDTWVDVEAALEAVHRAESAVTQGRWHEAWGAALVSRYVARRRFLAGHDAAWVEAWRRRLAAAERTSLELIERAPFRESGYQLLMEVKAARGNVAWRAPPTRASSSPSAGTRPGSPSVCLTAWFVGFRLVGLSLDRVSYPGCGRSTVGAG
jgi:hypothetical protein